MVVLAARSHIRGDRFFLGEMKMDTASLILVLQHTTTFTTTEDGEDPTRGRDGREAKETQKKRVGQKRNRGLVCRQGLGYMRCRLPLKARLARLLFLSKSSVPMSRTSTEALSSTTRSGDEAGSPMSLPRSRILFLRFGGRREAKVSDGGERGGERGGLTFFGWWRRVGGASVCRRPATGAAPASSAPRWVRTGTRR